MEGSQQVNTLEPWQDAHHLAKNNFQSVFLNGYCFILIKVLLIFVPGIPSIDSNNGLVLNEWKVITSHYWCNDGQVFWCRFLSLGLDKLTCEILHLIGRNMKWCMYLSGERLLSSQEDYFGVYFPSCCTNWDEKHQNNTSEYINSSS